MRKMFVSFAMMGLIAAPLAACDVESAEGDTTNPGGDTNNPDTNNPDTNTPTTEYAAVIIDDSKIFPTHRSGGGDPCATASGPAYAHGADIDAVGLFDGNDLIGYFDQVDYEDGGICTGTKANTMNDATQAKGPPDGKITSGFVALAGGFLVGEFEAQALIQQGYDVEVYEVGKKCGTNSNCGGTDEGYEVFIATDLDCPRAADYPYSTCAKKISSTAKGQAIIPVPAF